jgi:NhaP-type Na+/H+ or K+/H+ antiporter
VLGLAVCAYASAVALHGNGFIAAFVGGLAFGTAAGRRGEPLVPFVEETGALVSLLVWLAFGAVAIAPALGGLTWQLVVYGAEPDRDQDGSGGPRAGRRGLGRRAAASIGWFGPRGLASVVFALLALEDLGEQVTGLAVTVIAVAVLFSMIAHGATAEPLARRYGPLLAPAASRDDPPGLPELPPRRLIRRAPAPAPPDRRE